MSAPITVSELLDAYMRYSQAVGLHTDASRRYREITYRRFKALYGDEPADSLKPFHLTDFVESHQGYRSVASRRAAAAQVKAAFQWAADSERILRNQFARVRYSEAERRPDMPDSFLEFLAQAANKQVEHVLRFLRFTWCRQGEMCAAQWEDFDLEQGTWTIRAHKTRKQTQKVKVVALIPEAIALLRDIRAGRVNAEGTVFLNTRGKPWRTGTLGSYLRHFKTRHKLKEPSTLHGLRHAGASAALGSGAPIKLVAEQLGHASTATVEKYYFHRSAQHLESIRAAAQAGAPRKAEEERRNAS